MEILEELNQLPEDTRKIVSDGISFYETLKGKKILNNENKPYNNHDKKCLSLFLGILKNDNSASKLLGDFDITYQKVLDVICFPNNKEKVKKEEEQYDKEILNLIKIIKDSNARYYTRDLTPLLLLNNLFLDSECSSYFLADIYVKLGLIHPCEQLFAHQSFNLMTRQLELEENEKFSSLENNRNIKQKEETRSSIKNNELLNEIGMNPYNIDLSFGRDNDIKKIMISLLMPGKSVMLIGPSGVGKTSIVSGLAYRIATGKVPDMFLDKKIFSLNVASLVSGCKYVGTFEKKLIKLLDEIEQDKDIIVFIDEIHAIVGAGKGSNNSNDMANILKPYLESGKIKVIGATTTEEYETYISKDSGLKRRFELVKIKEPDDITLEAICNNAINKLQLEMGIFFLEDSYVAEYVIKELIKVTNKKYRVYNDIVNNPDLIISIINRSFAIAKYYGKQVVEIDDLIEAVSDNDRLYNYNISFIIKKLKLLEPLYDNKPIKTNAKIIQFPKPL